MTRTDPSKIIIVGAGTTGLALAQGLKKAGIAFTVYERAPSAESKRNWDFGLHWGIEPLRELVPEHFWWSIDECQVDPHIELRDEHFRMPLINAANGTTIKILESSKFYRFRRDKFRKWLLQDLDVHFGKEISKIEYGEDGCSVLATFRDGSQDSGSLLVGCDGSRSAVRHLLLGAEAAALKPIGNFATAMIYAKHKRENALVLRAPPNHPLYQVGIHPAGYACFLSVHDAEDKLHPEQWTFFSYISYEAPPGHDEWPKEQLVTFQRDLAKDFGEPWRSSYEWLSEDESNVWLTKLMDWDPREPEHAWNNHAGRVTLAGDAAHPMSFQRGQGLNNALQDAFELCNAIRAFVFDNEDQLGAIATYEAEMKARGGKEVQLSRENTFMVHSKSGEESHLSKQGMVKTKSQVT
ncbi:Putative FAD-binding domain, FAD/NAD(P)-binding domain superfamily [Septoria linicola]|uniref:FAD-binding domain, FAD/NAD(P)-binding domain superfamily n=1 Tax=Septoria linicola TaxID=215465 RepID=A0A9Q9AUK6_9PEZI|nr:putative FAD-binding domain, FAD/NAD(P)-binding domain superfamily [Septoria linicola]USW56137.1 Putative FAD-binding domain, FAD/NAD(P)-binding domain superfamily [Septoria linicola]